MSSSRAFLDETFLLPNDPARRLFFDYAEDMPIFDYHNHLPPREINADRRFGTIAEIWLGGDHYKWRAMRANGIPESEITGKAPDYSTFLAWARTVPKTIGNPLFHWTHLELRRYFGIREVLDETTALRIWEACNEQLKNPKISAVSLLKRMKVRALCTTDDPADSLEDHIAYAARQSGTAGGGRGPAPGIAGTIKSEPMPLMFPTFRPDKALAVDKASMWREYLGVLGKAAGIDIRSLADLVEALGRRHDFFHQNGCRLSDHALVSPGTEYRGKGSPETLLTRLLLGENLDDAECDELRTTLLVEVARMNAAKGWTMQLHIGAIRNLNSSRFHTLGPDTGYDAMGDSKVASGIAAFFDRLAAEGSLPKTILYSLNPSFNEVLVTIMGCFQDGTLPGKIQLGSAWWFNDHINGMDKQMRDLANNGLLSRFVGMLTDSRSFLSFPRHEYFRRLLCRLIGTWVNEGEAPADFPYLGGIISDICYRNARGYFDLPGVPEN